MRGNSSSGRAWGALAILTTFAVIVMLIITSNDFGR